MSLGEYFRALLTSIPVLVFGVLLVHSPVRAGDVEGGNAPTRAQKLLEQRKEKAGNLKPYTVSKW